MHKGYLSRDIVHMQWRFSKCHEVWDRISRKPREIETPLQRNTDRKRNMANRMVTWSTWWRYSIGWIDFRISVVHHIVSESSSVSVFWRTRCLHGTAPPYFAETLQRTSDMSARRHLQSAATPTLVVPSTRRSTLGDRAFPVAAARVWNSLPSSLRGVQSLTTFRHSLKAELFDSSFTWLSYCTINMRVFSLILYSALATAIAVSRHYNHSLV